MKSYNVLKISNITDISPRISL